MTKDTQNVQFDSSKNAKKTVIDIDPRTLAAPEKDAENVSSRMAACGCVCGCVFVCVCMLLHGVG